MARKQGAKEQEVAEEEKALDEALGLSGKEEDELAAYDNMPVEMVGGFVDSFIRQSRQVAEAKGRMMVAQAMLKDLPKGERKPFIDEIKNIEKNELPPLKRRVLIITRQITDLFAQDGQMRNQVIIWRQLPRNLRPMIKNGLLGRHKINVAETVDRANEIDREIEQRQLEAEIESGE